MKMTSTDGILWIALTATACSGAALPPEKPTSGAHDGTIAETGFEGRADESIYDLAAWGKDGFMPLWAEGFDTGRARVDTAFAHSGAASLRIAYPAGTFGPDINGAQAPLYINDREEACVSYWLRFSDNFEWGGADHGGKLPGLGSGENCSGGASCDGTNGFSARLMWRRDGRAVLYLYHMDKPGHWGEDVPLIANGAEVFFKKGQWHQVIERVKINTGADRNGEVQIWIDGTEALMKTGIRFVNDGSRVDNFYFSTFHGGDSATWAPSVDCFIYFDDIHIYTAS